MQRGSLQRQDSRTACPPEGVEKGLRRDSLGCPAAGPTQHGGYLMPPPHPGVTLCPVSLAEEALGTREASRATKPIPHPDCVCTRMPRNPVDHAWCQHHCPVCLPPQEAEGPQQGQE